MKKVLLIIVPILICFLIGTTAGYFQSESIISWYPLLNKAPLTPPNYIFPIAWGILYVCMGVSIGLILQKNDSRKEMLTTLFILQLFFNFMWSILFFYFRNPLLGLADILILDVIVIAYAIQCYPVKKVSSYLFFPYIAWILFATYLNAYILFYN